MFTLYHNPRCSKSREALALLQQAGVAFNVVEYLKTPLDATALQRLLTKLDLPASAVIRRKEPEYQTLNGDGITLSEQALFEALLTHPKLLERPILETEQRAVIGRPVSNLQALLP